MRSDACVPYADYIVIDNWRKKKKEGEVERTARSRIRCCFRTVGPSLKKQGPSTMYGVYIKFS